MYCLLDSTHQMSPSDVLRDSEKWELVDDPANFNLGYNNCNVWLKLRLKNKKIGKDYILTIDNAHLDTLVLYKYKDDTVQETVFTGDRQIFSKREHQSNIYVFTLSDTCDFFLIKSASQGILALPVTVKDINEHVVDSNTDTMVLSVFFGIVLISVLLNILLYYRIRESIYLFYVLCLLGNAVLNAIDSGVAFQFLWPDHPGINLYSGVFYASAVTALLFSQKFLSLKEIAPVLNKCYYVLFVYLLVMVLISVTGHYNVASEYLLYYFYVSSFLFLFSGVYMYFVKKYKPAFYYMLAWGIYGICAIIYLLASEGFLPYTFLTKNAAKIGNTLEIVFLFLAVVDKIYDLGEAKKHSDVEALRLAEENREILLARNNALEKFANFTAHNVRGPVSSIMGLVNLFQLVNGNEEETSKVVGLIRQSAQKLDEVVKDMIMLLALNNQEESQREELSAAPAYYESKELFVSTLPDEVVVAFDESIGKQRIVADEMILRFVFEQLFDNSYKFREASRLLNISVKETEEDGYVCICFSDNGIGFDSVRYKEDVFGLYKRFHNNGQGKGLGLYFIKEYMRKIKGKVNIASRVDEGTMVKLYFEKGK
jgi:signal transduction histidine kinase